MAPRRKITKDRCTVCSHPERLRIETLRLSGVGGVAIAEKFGLSKSAVFRHMAEHVEPEIKAQIIADVPLSDMIEKATAEGMSVIDGLNLVRNTTMRAMLAAAAVNDFTATAAGAKRTLEALREIGRFTGELLNAAPVRNYVQNNITFSDPNTMDRMEAMLIERLSPFPGALQAVQAGLLSLSTPTAPMIDVTPHGGSHVA